MNLLNLPETDVDTFTCYVCDTEYVLPKDCDECPICLNQSLEQEPHER